MNIMISLNRSLHTTLCVILLRVIPSFSPGSECCRGVTCFIIDDTNSKEEDGVLLVARAIIYCPVHLIQRDDTWGEPGQCRGHYYVISGVINGYIRDQGQKSIVEFIDHYFYFVVVISLRTKIL